MRSANDVAVAIAETLGGDEASFVKEMNQTAARLGMAHTHFINPHGLPAEQQVTTARDMGLLAQALLRDFPEEAPLYAQTQATIQKITIGTHNALLTGFPGGDGIKTGYTCASGYNLVASATRNGRRLIAVILGESSGNARTARAAALLENGFRTREWKSAFPIAARRELPERCGRRRLRARSADARALPRLQGAAAPAAGGDRQRRQRRRRQADVKSEREEGFRDQSSERRPRKRRSAASRSTDASGRRLELRLDRIPDQRRDVGAAELLHLADAGGRGDVDLRQVRPDDVDAGEQQAAPLQLRPEPRADLLVALRQLGRLGRAADVQVGARLARRPARG